MEPTSSDPGASVRGRYYVLAVLTAIGTVNFIDRQILVILQEPIKREMGLSDTQLGLLTGFAFVALYVTCGIPIAHLADRSNRRNIIAGAVMAWSGMTALTGLANSFVHLLMARVGVGFGEAGATPPSHSMIADLFPPRERATALSIFQAGYPLGVLVGFLVGGYVGQTYGWRLAFLIAGCPGILLGLLTLLTVREPLRVRSKTAPVERDESLFQAFAGLWRLKPFRACIVALIAATFGGYGIMGFTPNFLIRSYGLSLSQVGAALALIHGVGGLIVPLGVGALADRLAQRDQRWRLWLSGLTTFLVFPSGLAAYLVHDVTLSLVFYALFASLVNAFFAPAISALQTVVPANRLALTTAILYFLTSLFGLGFGTMLVGVLSDALTPAFGGEALRHALAIASAIYAVAGVLLIRAARSFAAGPLGAAEPVPVA